MCFLKRLRASFWIGFVIFCVTGNTYADHPTMGLLPEMAGPIVTIPAVVLPQHGWSLGFRLELIQFDEFSDAELEKFAEEDRDVHSLDRLVSPSLAFAYGLTDHFTMGLRLPHVERKDIREAHHDEEEHGDVENLGDATGIGDLSVFGQYRVLHRPQSGMHGTLLFGLKMPTGQTDEENSEGERFEAEHQPGSGSWDPMMGLAFTRQMGALCLNANVLYVLAIEGSQDTDLGDAFSYNLALSFRLPEMGHAHQNDEVHSHATLDLILEANGEWRARQEARGEEDPNTGGDLLYVSPGIRLSMDHGLSLSLSFGIPVWEDLNGVQSEPDYRVILSVGVGR